MGVTRAALYAETRDASVEALVTQYAPLVKRIAYHLAGRLPRSVQSADLMQAGMIGLLEAARHYDASQGASFETYAGIRIRGAMLDEVRRGGCAPRSVHRRAREIAEAINRVESVKGAEARDNEIAEAMGLSLEEYHQALQDVNGHRVLSFDDVGQDGGSLADTIRDPGLDPMEGMQAREARRAVAEAIESLPERERLVLALYYDEELNLKEIGAVLGVSESRVCQIHGQALARLRARLTPEAGKLRATRR